MFTQIATIVAGLWLMVAPAVLGYGDSGAARAAANNDWIVGPLVASFATVALWQATRAVRWVNVALGVWLMLAALVLPYPEVAAILVAVTGLAVAVLASRGGRISHAFGGGWRVLWRTSDK
jgi:hypothetical protein